MDLAATGRGGRESRGNGGRISVRPGRARQRWAEGHERQGSRRQQKPRRTLRIGMAMRRERHASKQVPSRQARRWHGTRQITENALRETGSPDWRRRQTSGTRFNLVNGAYVRHARRNAGLSPWAQFAGPGGRRRGLPLSRSGVPLATRSFSSLSLYRAVLGVMRANGVSAFFRQQPRTLSRRDAA